MLYCHEQKLLSLLCTLDEQERNWYATPLTARLDCLRGPLFAVTHFYSETDASSALKRSTRTALGVCLDRPL